MSYSIQDVATRLSTLERKVEFVLKSVPVMKRERSLVSPTGFTVKQLTLLDLYRELQATNAELVPVLEGEVIKNDDTVTDAGSND